MEKSKLEQIMELCDKVSDIVVDYHVDGKYDEEAAKKLAKEVHWIIQTESYREAGLPIIQLMDDALDLVMNPDYFTEFK